MSTAVSVTNASVTFALRRVAGRISVLVYADTNKASSYFQLKGAQWLSGRVLASRPRGRGFEPHRRHCVVVLEKNTFILA